MAILITGGTGFIGTLLVRSLIKDDEPPIVLSRYPDRAKQLLGPLVRVYPWHAAQEFPPKEALSNVDAVVSLAGENIAAHRWTQQRKKGLFESRVLGTRHLMEGLRSHPPRVVISASAIGYYGDRADETLTETSAPGTGFLADVCKAWEKEVENGPPAGTRTVILRIGIVLGKDGGMLSKMLPIFQKGLGGNVGGGMQWMSWIHVHDLVRLIRHVLNHPDIQGPINAVAPTPVRYKHFVATLSREVNRPAILPVPACILRLLIGEMSTLALSSVHVSCEKVINHGFKFHYPTLEKALGEILSSRA